MAQDGSSLEEAREEAGEDATPNVLWAERRTDWAEDRTLLANERTFAGWMRTGMGSLAVAIGLHAVFRSFDPTWLARVVASVFVLAAVLTFFDAARRARQTQKRINSHDAEVQTAWRMSLLAGLLIAGALGTGVILWLL